MVIHISSTESSSLALSKSSLKLVIGFHPFFSGEVNLTLSQPLGFPGTCIKQYKTLESTHRAHSSAKATDYPYFFLSFT